MSLFGYMKNYMRYESFRKYHKKTIYLITKELDLIKFKKKSRTYALATLALLNEKQRSFVS